MNLFHILWTHWYVALGILMMLGGTALVLHDRVARLVRLAKAAATDPRLPRSVRALFAVGIAVKALPVPDFGIDELALGVGIVLLCTRYRSTWAEIRRELR